MVKTNRLLLLSILSLVIICLVIFYFLFSGHPEKKPETIIQVDRLIEEGKKNIDGQLFDLALQKYEESLEQSDRLRYERGYGKSLFGIGTVHRLQGNNPLAQEFYRKALIIYSRTGDSVGIAETKNSMALVHTNTGEYAEALDLFFQSLGILRRHKVQEEESNVLLNMGRLYTYTNDLDNALYYTGQSLVLKRRLSTPGGVANALNNLGVIYRRKGEMDKALAMFEESLAIQRSLGDKTGIANSLNNIGIIYHSNNQSDKAIQYFREALSIREELGDKSGIAMGLYNLGYMYSVIENTHMALEYFTRSIEYSLLIKDNNYRLRGYEAISELYQKTGDYRNALLYFQQFKQLNDSLFNEKNKNQLNEIQVKFATVEKEKELSRIRQISLALGALLLMALAFVLVVFLLSAKRKNINRKLAKQNKEIKRQARKLAEARDLLSENLKLKELFFTAANHELRVPLNIIKGFAELIEKKIEDKDLLKYIDGIKGNSKSLQKLVDDILDFSTIESEGFRLDKAPVNILNLAKDIHDIFVQQLKGRPIKFIVTKDRSLDRWLLLDEVRIRQIIYNLMENAMKFTGEGEINLSFQIRDDAVRGLFVLTIITQDTGIGIPEDCQSLVMDTSYKTKPVIESHRIGYGLGLQIINRLVKCMNGKIKLESSSEMGTMFEIELPGIEHGNNFQENKNDKYSKDEITPAGANLLIVDDSELNRRLLAVMLKEHSFETCEAEDGVEALQAISSKKPELILMDLYMPNLDGYNTLKKLKRNKLTRSIPVIAVTASASEEEKENVYAAGFDAYITKPVDKNLLLNEIHQLIRKNMSFRS